jgi:hypothetical protein
MIALDASCDHLILAVYVRDQLVLYIDSPFLEVSSLTNSVSCQWCDLRVTTSRHPNKSISTTICHPSHLTYFNICASSRRQFMLTNVKVLAYRVSPSTSPWLEDAVWRWLSSLLEERVVSHNVCMGCCIHLLGFSLRLIQGAQICCGFLKKAWWTNKNQYRSLKHGYVWIKIKLYAIKFGNSFLL